MTSMRELTVNTTKILSVPIAAGVFGLLVTIFLASQRVLKLHPGGPKLIEIAEHIKQGARAFLVREYTYLSVFVLIMFVAVGAATSEWEKTGSSFIIGAVLSASCGWLGMSIAVEANVRTTHAAAEGLNAALSVAFASGAVMGLSVVCSGILGLVVIYSIWTGTTQEDTRYLAGFGFGASSIALFARVGGGIYTKAADVGADLVGKVEAGIPEDDPKNPATIADNVGDNVGDVAGMGADLFESFVGSIIATIQLSEQFANQKTTYTNMDERTEDIRALIALPFWIAGFGIIVSILGIFLVRTNEAPKDRIQEVLLNTIRRGIFVAAFLSSIMSLVSCGILFGFSSRLTWELWFCTLIGLISGVFIGVFTEYATSFAYKPTRSIAKKSRIGSAGVVIQGLGIGMLSTMAPVIIIFAAILACFELANNYGIGLAAVGMLSTLGVTLATDAFGPVADNAGGIAEMAEEPEYIRDTTDALDALGNTTAATGKGFAIGSAVLSSLALLNAYKIDAKLTQIDISQPEVLAAGIFGACLPYIFAAMTMMAVGRAASMMIEEVRRQFREYKLLSKNPVRSPDYQRCVAISTEASVREMVIPGVLAIVSPLFIGCLLGASALGGMLVGAITSGFMLAVFMANAGGAWDNAKKWIEAGQLGEDQGKGSEEHKAVVVGDTIGDPFKDTSGPALNILIKLMTMISLVFAKNVFRDTVAYDTNRYWIAIIIGVLFLILTVAITLWMRHKGVGKINFQDKNTIQANDYESLQIEREDSEPKISNGIGEAV